jgi:predicted nucleic acid-binding protein
MRVFLDANVLFSAAKSDGAMRRLLTMLRDSGHVCVADAYVVEEARRNLAAKAPDAVRALDRVLSAIEEVGIRTGEVELDRTLPLPEKDKPVLASAIGNRSDVLVTGDRTHFGALYGRTVRGVAIHSPRSLAETLLS